MSGSQGPDAGGGGLIVSTADGRWVEVPSIPGALVVNTGELLKQWSNDRMPSTRHFANNNNSGGRSSWPAHAGAAAAAFATKAAVACAIF